MKNALKPVLSVLMVIFLAGCSLNKMIVRLSVPIIEARISALFQEDDYELVKASFPSNIKSLEGMLVNDPENSQLHVYTAYAYYSYAFTFVEDEDRDRASGLYYRCLQHGKQGLQGFGIDEQLINGPTDELQQAINAQHRESAEALFWTALCWAKIIEINREQVLNIFQWHKAVIMMKRVQQLDASIYLHGPDLFFGVYYGSRPPLLGGDYQLSERYFDEARRATNNRLLIVDLLQAQYLERQRHDRQAFRKKLKAIIAAPDTLVKEYALVNVVAKRKAQHLLKKEQQWF
jgi:hypothetical protein